MTSPMIPGKRPVFSASGVLQALGAELSAIKAADGLTWSDMAAVLGKSPDQAAKYADGSAAMDVVTFYRAKREWNGRFTGAADRLCVESRQVSGSDHQRHCNVLKAALAFAEALADDGIFDAEEARQHRAVLETARDAIGDVLGRIAPRGVAA